MANERIMPAGLAVCAACSRALPRNAPGGLCPACLMGEGVKLATSSRAKPGGFVPPTDDEMALLFSDFDAFEFIGQGGMGAVYKALQPELDRMVAIKILAPETGADPEFTERFRREAATLARLDHPNIVKLFDYGQREGFACFVMEYVDGPDLSRRMMKGPLPRNEAFAIASQLCDALQHSHERGVVHRDIKPGNILIAPDGRVKVADFGVARLVHPEGTDEKLTRTRSTLGTPRYMAPEQMTPGHSIDHRADIYSAGVVLYEMLTGTIPAGNFEPPSKKVAALNPRVDEVILRSLNPEPAGRFRFAAELKSALHDAIENPVPTRQERARALAFRVFLASVIAAALGIAGALVWSWRERAEAPGPGPVVELAPAASSAGRVVVLNGDSNSIPFAGEMAVAVATASAREEFGLVLRPDGSVRGWGSNRFGQTQVPAGLDNVIAIAAGQGTRSAHALALRLDGTVVGWGDNTFRQARPPTDLAQVAAIAAGELHSLALDREGRVVAWGNQAGNVASVPDDLPPAKGIAAGADFSMALLKDGRVVAWGANDAGQCDVPAFPAAVVEIAAGARHGLARLRDGRIFAWGDNTLKQCGVPAGLPPIARIFARGEASAAVDAAGRFYTWGNVPETLRRFTRPIRELAIGSTTWLALLAERETNSVTRAVF